MKQKTKRLLISALSLLFVAAVGTACKDGENGKSAYELAVEQGFEGTVDEWLASLIGAKGETGVGIANITVDYRGIVVITLTNGEKYETTIDKACAHEHMETLVTYPTCATPGYTSYHCSDCGISYKDNYTAASGHHLYNNECLFCDYEAPYSEIEVDTAWYDSSVSSYTLTTREELAGLSYLVNNGNNFSGKTIIIGNHIDLGNAEWIPIGTNKSTPFAGTFDGQMLTISGLKITNPTSYAGFFGYVTGTIKNFHISGANVTVNGSITIDNYAAIACAYSSTAIVGVSTDGYLNATVTNYVGGVAGYIASGAQNCYNNAQITAAESNYVGGIAGYASAYGNYTLTTLSNTGAILGSDYVGGLIGYFNGTYSTSYNDSTYNTYFDAFNNSGNVTGNTYVGGLVGYSTVYLSGSGSDGSTILTVNKATNAANVTGTTYVGGFFGYSYSDNNDSQILKSNSSGNITAQAYVGGFAGKLENVRLVECDNTNTQVLATLYETDGSTYYAYVGGFAGFSYAIENCHNVADIIYNERGMYVGGLAGYTTGPINNSSNTKDVIAENASYVGGLCGRFSATGNYTLAEISNSANVTGADYVGGLIGEFSGNATWDYNDALYNIYITKATNTGNIYGYNYVSGLIAYFSAAITGSGSDGSVILTLSDSENKANITGDSYVGGLFGYASTDSSSSQIYNTTSCSVITAKYFVGGLAGKLSNIKLISCDNAGSQVVATSYMASGTTYYAYVGGYAGQCYYIENCHNSVNITYLERGMYVGGIAGEINGSVVNCSNEATITAEKSNYVGGLAGLLSATGNQNYTNIENSGAVVGLDYVGGLFGYFNNHASWNYNDDAYSVQVRNVHNTATISGVKYVGGFFGRVNAQITGSGSDGSVSMTVLESSNSGNIIGNESVGSLIGEFYSDRTSNIVGYQLTGAVNGEEVSLDTLVGVKSGLTISEA